MGKQSSVDGASLKAYADSVRDEFEDALAAWVETPSVSSDPERKGDVRRQANLAEELFAHHGGSARIVETKGYPVVVGMFEADPKAPTVTVYNHLDVQPADPTEWENPPFAFTKKGDRYLGRGATDDKGPALTVFYAARWARQQGLPLNIRFIWELEEEVGSPSFDEFLRAEKDSLKTDSVVVSDTVWISRERPAVAYGLRGLLGFSFRLRTGTKDVHSGLTGGAARNPFGELAELIARCHDAKTGRIKIPGIYDDVKSPSKSEVAEWVASGFQVAKFKADHGLLGLRSTDKAALLKSIWGSPTFEVHGFSGGYSGPAIKTIVPPFAEAKISMRLVPNQDPKKVLQRVRAFVKSINPDVEVVQHGILAPFLTASGSDLAAQASEAIRRAFGKKPVFVREGGSIGAVLSMNQRLKTPVLLMGLSLPEHGYHAPNEFYDWGQAAGGMAAFAHYFSLLSGARG